MERLGVILAYRKCFIRSKTASTRPLPIKRASKIELMSILTALHSDILSSITAIGNR